MHFIFETLTVSVTSDAPSDTRWLAEFFGPACRVSAKASGAARTIRLREDASLHNAYTLALPRTGSTAVGFVMDSGTVDLCVFRDGAVRVAYDPSFDAFYRIESPHMVEVIDRPHTATGSPRRARGALMRVVREWVMNSARGAGHLAFHAAGISRFGRAVLFAGGKQAGKTTLTSACLLAEEGWGLLANDRILIAQRDAWQCRGMATIVSIRSGSYSQLPELADRLGAVTGGAFARIDESRVPAPLVDGRSSLSPAQFARALATSLVEEATLRTVAFPSINADGDGLCWQRITPNEAAGRLSSALFAASAARVQSELFEVPDEIAFADDETVRERINRLVTETDCVEIGLGRSAYDSAAVAELLRSLGR